MLILIKCRVHQRTSLSGSLASGAVTPEGTPVLREAHMTRFPKMFAVSGMAMATAIGLSWVVASPAPTNASTYVAAQIDPDQMTRNAPRDLPSFDQTYQRHLGVLDVLPH